MDLVVFHDLVDDLCVIASSSFFITSQTNGRYLDAPVYSAGKMRQDITVYMVPAARMSTTF